jgi:adenylate kinase
VTGTQLNVILLGAPGAGKGTQAERISARFGLPHISTGDMLRAAVAQGTEMGLAAKEFMDAGALVPDDVVIGVVRDRLAESDAVEGFLLDGFPRTIEQAESLDAMLTEAGRSVTEVLLLVVPETELVDRLAAPLQELWQGVSRALRSSPAGGRLRRLRRRAVPARRRQ